MKEKGKYMSEEYYYDFDINKVEISGIFDFRPGPGNLVIASYDDTVIAEFYFDCFAGLEDEIVSVTLHTANVKEQYRLHGVGTKIIKDVKREYPEILARNVVNNTVENKNDIHYSEEGLSFIQSCIKKGLIKDAEEENPEEEEI